MILGGFLGALVAMCIILIIVGIATIHESSRWDDTPFQIGCTIVSIVIFIGSVYLGALIGKDIDIKTYEMKIRNWKNTTAVIENSMSNSDISDLEKVQLIQDIVIYNMQLEECKTDVTYWWNWYLDDSKVNELQPISIDK